uniref:Sulfotransferase domain-containing protein n=1 Tax=Megaselia scalaris TaxID=36166 RepID=T1GXY4_MEGSC
MQETAWLVQNDFDFDKANSIPLTERSPFVEIEGLQDGICKSFKKSDDLPSPRLLKSHLPASFLPKEIWQKRSKIIYKLLVTLEVRRNNLLKRS